MTLYVLYIAYITDNKYDIEYMHMCKPINAYALGNAQKRY